MPSAKLIPLSNTGTPDKKLIVAGIICWAIITVVYSVILTSILKNFNLSEIEVIVDAAVNNILLTGSCILILNNMRYYLPRREKYWYVLTISLALSGVCTLLARGI